MKLGRVTENGWARLTAALLVGVAIGYWLAPRPVVAQAGGNTVVAATITAGNTSSPYLLVFTTNGDVYLDRGTSGYAWEYRSNVFTGAVPVETTPTTLGQLKARYRTGR